MKQKGKEETTVNCSASWSLICLYGATNADNGPHQITHTMQIEKDDDETSEKLLPGIVFVIYIVSMWMRRPKTLNNTRFQYSFHWFFGEIDLYQMYAPRNRINNETKETKWSTELLKLDSAPPPSSLAPSPQEYLDFFSESLDLDILRTLLEAPPKPHQCHLSRRFRIIQRNFLNVFAFHSHSLPHIWKQDSQSFFLPLLYFSHHLLPPPLSLFYLCSLPNNSN